MQHPRLAQLQRGRVLVRVHALTCRLDADQSSAFMRDVGVKNPHRIATTANAGDHRVGLAAGRATEFLDQRRHLLQAFLADDALEVAHHRRIRVRAGHGADDVEGVLDVRHPVAHRLIQGILERLAAALDRDHLGAKQMHAVDIRALALDVFGTHIDHALQTVAGTDRRGRDAMLAGAGLGDHARFAHALGQQRLADHVVDLVRAGVVQVFTLQIDLRAAHLAAHASGVINRARATDEVLQFAAELSEELRIAAVAVVSSTKLVERMTEGFSNEAAAIDAEVTSGVGLVIGNHGSPKRRERKAPALLQPASDS